jgi:hydrogenase maturation protease
MNCNAADPGPPASPAAGRVLVVGYGNTLRGDDAFGPVVADRLRQIVDSDRVHVLSRHQLTPELAEDIAVCDRVIFIDASRASPAGELVCRPLDAGESGAAALVHTVGPDQLLALARLVYGRAPPATLVTVGGQSFELGDRLLSPPVATAVELAVECLRERIDAGSAIRASEILAACQRDR